MSSNVLPGIDWDCGQIPTSATNPAQSARNKWTVL